MCTVDLSLALLHSPHSSASCGRCSPGDKTRTPTTKRKKQRPRHDRHTGRYTDRDITNTTKTPPGHRPKHDRYINQKTVENGSRHDRDTTRPETAERDTNRNVTGTLTKTRPLTEARPDKANRDTGTLTETRPIHRPEYDRDVDTNTLRPGRRPRHDRDFDRSATGTPTGMRQGRACCLSKPFASAEQEV